MLGLRRRDFLGLAAAGLAWPVRNAVSAPGPSYSVGVGKGPSPYEATLRAVQASAGWPSDGLSGKTVVIKPNLVAPVPADTGATTDPEVIRALVDLSLDSGAPRVLIVEGGSREVPFLACGYGLFNDYEPGGRVLLVDLNREPEALRQVPSGLAYGSLWIPEIVLGPDVFFVSAAKMKTHVLALATLSLKNLFGLPLCSRYEHAPSLGGRFGMHRRGVHQVVSDLFMVRPIDFAVVDGIWAMEGDGPVQGTPVRVNTVLAGRNALAVDRVCLDAMGIPQWAVQHVNYLARRGQGPSDVAQVQISGDPLTRRPFKLPKVPPPLGCPWPLPRSFSPRQGERIRILYWTGPPASWVRLRIVQGSPDSPELVPLRILQDWRTTAPGLHLAMWDGRDDQGEIVPGPGSYAVQVQAARTDLPGRTACSVGWVHVNG